MDKVELSLLACRPTQPHAAMITPAPTYHHHPAAPQHRCRGANNVAYLFLAVLASTSEHGELDVQHTSHSMRPAAPETSKWQIGTTDNSPPVLEGPVSTPNPAHYFSLGSAVADRETFRASGIACSCYFPRSWVLAATEVEKPTAWKALVVIAQQHGDSTTCDQLCLALKWRWRDSSHVPVDNATSPSSLCDDLRWP